MMKIENKKLNLFLATLGLGSLMVVGAYGCKKQGEVPQADVEVTAPAAPAGGETGGGLESEGNSVDRFTNGIINRNIPGGQLPPAPPGGGGTNLTPPTIPACGDGYLSLGVETCEDGNTVSGDGCTNCQLDGPPAAPVCGNKIHEAGEKCDDGNTSTGDGCDATCQIELVGGSGPSGPFNLPPPETNAGCTTGSGPTNPLCAWTLLGAFGIIANPVLNFTGVILYQYNDEGNPFQQITANIVGEPVDVGFNVFDTEDNPIFKQGVRRANLSVPGPLNVLSLEFSKYLSGGGAAGEIQDKFVFSLDPNRQMMLAGKPSPGLFLGAFNYNYTDPNFNPLITNTNLDFVALSPVPPAQPSPLGAIQIIEGHKKDAQGKLQRILKGFKTTANQWIRFEDTYIVPYTTGNDVGKIEWIVTNSTNCAEDQTGTHCNVNNLLSPIVIMHGVMWNHFAYDAEGRLDSVTITEFKNPTPGQPVDMTTPAKESQCEVEYWDNPHNIPIHKLPQFFKDLGFTDTGLVKGMACQSTSTAQQTFGQEGFYFAFIWKPLWTFIPTAEIPQ